ncbi:MAG: YeeE/YedE family protein [Acidobacteria bacterium]|nr:YeeE/YedE family protein [Acidobacteriota bacterium]
MTTAPSAASAPAAHRGAVRAALVLVAGGAVVVASAVSVRQSALFLVGVAAGLVLYHAAFGFTSSWRDLIANGRGGGLRAQMLMLAVTTAVFVPLIAQGSVFGQAVRGSVAPAGVPVLAGAFLFGVGMQLGGGCASGTLFSAGGGSMRMFVTLAAFIAGSVLGVRYTSMWDHAPTLRPMSLVGEFGAAPAVVISLAAFAAIYLLTLAVERKRYGTVRRDRAANTWRALHGPWTLAAGGVGLAGVNIATLLLAGRPWGVTAAFALWGAKVLMAAGVDVASWPYWQPAARAADLHASILRDVTSVMDIGIMLGAFGAAALAGRFAPVWRVPSRSLAAAVIGGLMLGYGARIAFGCNIGAYFSGVASTSLHGWVWLAAAFTGNILGTRLRPWFGLSV